MKTLRTIFTSNIFLAIVAIQVFAQVWSMATDMPILGMILGIWLSWKLGCMSAVADIMQRRIDAERLVAKEITELQADYDSLPAELRVGLDAKFIRAMQHLTHMHQLLVEQRNLPITKPKFRDMLPSPTRWLARRRQRKIMATAKVVHA